VSEWLVFATLTLTIAGIINNPNIAINNPPDIAVQLPSYPQLPSYSAEALNAMEPKDRARILLQERINNRAEKEIMLSQLQALRHQTAMSIINNIR
jgi:hypothetical protein